MDALLKQLFLILTYGGIVLGLFVVLILNNRNVRRGRANLSLSILLIALSFSIAHILFAGVVITHFSAKVYSIGDPTFYLIGPLLWFYTQELTGHRVSLTLRTFSHFLLFLVIIVFSLTLRSVESEAFLRFLNDHHWAITIWFRITLVIQFSWYQVLMQKRWAAYRKFIQEEVSNREGVDISWVRFFMIIFLLINLFFLFSLFAAIHLDSGSWLAKTTAVIFSLSVFALGYKGVLQREVLQRENELISVNATNTTHETSKPDQGLITKLLGHMEEKKPYLNSELTLSILARDLGISRSQLSSLINEGTGDNFYDFVNKYRVEEVKRLMTDPQVKNYNLLGIALEAGFKSKSTFNLIFKRFTGLTPSEYRKNLKHDI